MDQSSLHGMVLLTGMILAIVVAILLAEMLDRRHRVACNTRWQLQRAVVVVVVALHSHDNPKRSSCPRSRPPTPRLR